MWRPHGHIPIIPEQSNIFTAQFPDPIPLGNRTVHSIDIKRFTAPLGAGYCVTDYFAEGMSFRDQCWIAHLSPPPTGNFLRASVFVTITRWSKFNDVHLLAPLWKEGDEATRTKVIQAFHACATMSPELITELDRLERLAQQTQQEHPLLWAKAIECTSRTFNS